MQSNGRFGAVFDVSILDTSYMDVLAGLFWKYIFRLQKLVLPSHELLKHWAVWLSGKICDVLMQFINSPCFSARKNTAFLCCVTVTWLFKDIVAGLRILRGRKKPKATE